MPRDITLTFEDGSSHVYRNAPDNITPDEVVKRAQRDFSGKSIAGIDGGRGPGSGSGEAVPLPKWVNPSNAGAGRGSINPPLASESPVSLASSARSALESSYNSTIGLANKAGRGLVTMALDAVRGGAPAKGDSTLLDTQTVQNPTQPAPVDREVFTQMKAQLGAMPREDRLKQAKMPGWRGEVARAAIKQLDQEQQGIDRLKLGNMSPTLEGRTANFAAQGASPDTARAKALGEMSSGGVSEPVRFVGDGGQGQELQAQARQEGEALQGRSIGVRAGTAALEGLKVGAQGVAAAALRAVGDEDTAMALERSAVRSKVKVESINELTAMRQRAQEEGTVYGNDGFWESMAVGGVASAAQNAPQIAAGMALTALTKNPAAGTRLAMGLMTSQAFGDAYVEGRMKQLSPGQAASRAGIMAGFEYLGERFGLVPQAMKAVRGKASDVPLDELPAFLEKYVAALEKRGVLSPAAANLARGQLGEQFGEQITTAGQYWVDGTPLGLDQPVSLAGYFEAARDTAVQTLIATGVLQSGGAAGSALLGRDRRPEEAGQPTPSMAPPQQGAQPMPQAQPVQQQAPAAEPAQAGMATAEQPQAARPVAPAPAATNIAQIPQGSIADAAEQMAAEPSAPVLTPSTDRPANEATAAEATAEAPAAPELTDEQNAPQAPAPAAPGQVSQEAADQGSAVPAEAGQDAGVPGTGRPADAQADGLNGVAPGMVRVYHGGHPGEATGDVWFTRSLRDARGWASRGDGMVVEYVDVPESVFAADPEFGTMPPERIILPESIASKRQPIPGQADGVQEAGRPADAQAARLNKAAQRGRAQFQLDPESDTLLQALAKMGGLRRDVVAREFGLKPEELKHTVSTGKLKAYPFRKNGGMDMDEAITALAEAGYFDGVPEDELRGALESAIYEEFGGTPRLTAVGTMRRAAEAYNENQQQYADAAELDAEAQAEADAEREAIMAEAGLTASDVSMPPDEAFMRDAVEQDIATGMRAMGFTEEEIANELARQTVEPDTGRKAGDAQDPEVAPRQAQAPPGTGEAAPRPAGGTGRDAGAASQDAGRGQGGTEEGLTLTAQTEEDLRQKADREEAATKKAEAERKAEQERLRKADEQRDAKARADATVDDFQLGQTAEQQMSGMGDLFNAEVGQQATDDATRFSGFRADAPSIKARPPVNSDALRKLVSGHLQQWKAVGVDAVVPVDSWRELPEEILNSAESMGLSVSKIEGVMHAGRVYIVRNAITSLEQAERVLFHEVLGHMGLRGAIGGQPAATLDALWKKMNGLGGVEKLSRKLDAEPGVSVWQRLQPYVRGTEFADQQERRQIIMEELIAYAAQANDTGVLTTVKGYLADLKAAVVRLLKRLGLDRLAERFDRAGAELDVLALVRDARKAIMTGKTRDGRPFVFSVGDRLMTDDRGAGFSVGGMPGTINVDGKERPTTNSNGQPIHPTEEGVRNFWRWFGDSKVVDEGGKPLVMYHGTSASQDGDAFTFFDTYASNYGLMGMGGYFTADPDVASSYTSKGKGDSPTVYPVFVSIKNPIDMDAKANPSEWLRAFPAAGDFHEGGDTNESWYRAAEAALTEERVPRWEGAEIMQDGLRSMGYDGITHIGGGRVKSDGVRHRVFIAFDPEHVKSATGNNGQFDPAKSDIRFSVSPTNQAGLFGGNASNGYELPEFGRAAKFIEAVQNRYNRWKQAIEAVRKQGGTVTEVNDFYQAEERYWGIVGAQLDDFKGEVDGFVKAVQADGLELDDVALYAYALHAPERNARIAEINPKFPDGGSGMTDAQATQILDKAKADGLEQKLAKHAATLTAWTAGTRKVLLDNGLITPEEHKAWEDGYSHYVPLRGRIGEEGGRRGTGSGFDVRGKESFRAMGRRTQAQDIVEYILQDRAKALIRAGKNEVLRRFARFVLDNPDRQLWEINAVKRERKVVQTPTGEQLVVERSQLNTDRDDTVALKDGGQTIYITVRDQVLLQQLKNLHDEAKLPVIVEALHFVNRLLSRMYTSLNPVFTVLNGARDVLAGTVNMMGVAGPKGAASLVGNLGAAYREAYMAEVKGTPSAAYEEYRRTGGKTGFMDFKDIEGYSEELARIASESASWASVMAEPDGWKKSRSVWRRMRGTARKLIERIEAYNGAVENATRFAAFKAARDQGKSVAEAANVAKNITVNFNRRGSMTPVLSSFFLFFNPAVQGTARMLEALKSADVQKALGMGMASIFGLALANAVVGGDDDDDGMAYWDKIPDQVKDRNLIIMLPPGVDAGESVGKQGRYIKIPMPYGYNSFATLASTAADVIRHQLNPARGVSPTKGLARAAGSFLGSWFPVSDVAPSIGNPRAVALAFVPDSLDPIVEPALNINSFGKQLYPEGMGQDRLPDSEKVFGAQKNTWTHKTARWINDATGGSQYHDGLISVTPATVGNIVRGYGGGVAGFITSIADTVATQGVHRDRVEWWRAPFVKQLYGEVGVMESQALAYERLQQIEEVAEPIRRAKKANDLKAVEAMREQAGPFASLGRVAKDARQRLTVVRKNEARVIESDRMTDAEKNLSLRQWEVERQRVYAKVNRAYVDALRREAAED